MKIEGRCRNCGRSFPIDVLFAEPQTAGRCPFCGEPLDADYGPLLVQTLRRLQHAASAVESLLERATALGPNLEIEAASVLEPIREALARRHAESAERKAAQDAVEVERAPIG